MMNIKKLAISAATGALLLGSAAASVFALGTNGSFELGTDPGSFAVQGVGSTNITDWEVLSGTVDYIGTYWVASDGARSIDMTGGSAGTIGQVVPTTPGAVYKVTFDMAGNPAGGPVVKTMEVSAATDTQSYTFDTTGNTLADMGWEEKTFMFTAVGAATALRFQSMNSGFFGPALDNVVVEQNLPLTKDDCKKDGWMSFGVFKNQGDCVSFVATEGRNLPAVQ